MSEEFELIAAIRERLAAGGAPSSSAGVVLGSGDDAAIVAGGASATSVDMLVEGVHFEAPPFTLREVGHKALAVALSDLAAMGATPCRGLRPARSSRERAATRSCSSSPTGSPRSPPSTAWSSRAATSPRPRC